MKDTISRVEKRGEEVDYANPSTPESLAVPKASPKGPLEDAPGADKDRLNHCTYEVPVDPICTFEPEVPTLISSDVSCSSSGSRDAPSLKDEALPPPQNQQQHPSMITSSINPEASGMLDSGEVPNVNTNSVAENLHLECQPNQTTKDSSTKQQIDVIFQPSEITSAQTNKDGDENNSLGAASDDFSA
jgi:hypothetical protein